MTSFQKAILIILGLVACVIAGAVGLVAIAMFGPESTPPPPTNTPGPTATLAPTNTPGPTSTPIIYDWEGEGDDVIFFDAPRFGPGIMSAWYGGDGNFIITLYRDNGDYIDLLVNTTDEYQGKTTYQINQSGRYYLEINASGYDYKPKWHIIMAPPQ